MTRGASGIALAACLALACGPSRPAPEPSPPPAPLHLEAACDLAPAAGLSWLVEAEPRAIASIPDLIPAIARVVPEARLRAFAASHGGVDLRQITSLCVAGYEEALLVVARTPVDPARLERAFDERASRLDARAVVTARPPVVRLSGDVYGEPQQLVIFDRVGLALGHGRPAPLRAAEAFALGKLRRAAPALRGAALERAAARLGPAPLRVFAPGPFQGEAARGLGGLLRATTAVAASARFAGPPARIAVRVVLMGAWERDGDAAAERFAAAAHVLAESAPGRLFGLHEPLEGPVVRATGDALVLDVTLDGEALARGIHDALEAEVDEILRR